ncbi:hypothetical protein Tco_1567896, partial [Tanacetum coccineum]
AEEQEQERIAREKAQKIQEANIAWDDIQATEESSKKVEVEIAEETSSKRAGTELEPEVAKKQKLDDDKEEAEMKRHMEIVINEEEVAVDVIPLATKPPVIVEYKIEVVMFEPDIESKVWRSLEGHNVTVWKLFDSYGVHFGRFKNLHIFMLVEKKYPLTPATITGMLNKKLQIDQWNEMSYQLLKLKVKQQKNPGSV